MRSRSSVFLALALALAAMSLGEARADFIVDLGTSLNGSTPPGTAPYVTATFHTVSTGVVTVTVSASGLTGSAFVDEFLFNVAPSITPSSLGYSSTGGPTATITATTQDGQDGGSQVKGGLFDVLLSYGNNSLTGTSASSVVTITGTGITAESFAFGSTPVTQGSHTYGPYFAAADVKGFGSSGSIGTAAIVPVPEPSSLALAGLGLAGMAAFARRRAKASA